MPNDERPDLEKLLELCEKATPTPWEWQGDHSDDLLVAHGHFQGWGDGFPGFEDDKTFITESRTALPAVISYALALEAQLAEARQVYRCFHCGFETADEKEAAAHFGDRDEEFALCQMWASITADDKIRELQSTIRELEGERQDNALLRVRIEGLEYRFEGQRSEIHSFKPFRECDTIQQVFNVYDSMEGRALAGEEQRDIWKRQARDHEQELEAHATDRVNQRAERDQAREECDQLRELLLGSLEAARPYVKYALWGHKSPLCSEDYVRLAKHCEKIQVALTPPSKEAQ
jgi:hypothetical protein